MHEGLAPTILDLGDYENFAFKKFFNKSVIYLFTHLYGAGSRMPRVAGQHGM